MKKYLTWLWILSFAALGASAQVTEIHTFDSVNKPIPDGDPAGVADSRLIPSAISTISAVKVRLQITGEFNGDLYGYVTHSSGLTVLLNRAGRTAANPFGYADSGLDVTFEEGAANGDIHVYQGLSVPPAGTPLTGTWEPDGRKVHPSSVTDATARTAGLSEFFGLDADGTWTLFLADMESGGSHQLDSWEIEMTGQATPTITWSAPTAITYGTALGGSQLNASASVPGTFSYAPSAGAVLNAGDAQPLSVTFTPSDTISYAVVNAEVTIDVDPAPLTIAAVNKNRTYGSANPALTASYSGFVNGDNAGDLDTGVSVTTTAIPSSPVGTYPIVPSGAVDANYTMSFVNGTLTIGRAALLITADDQSRLFGEANPSLTVSYSGFVNGDDSGDLDTAVSVTTPAVPSSPVGAYPIVPGSAADANYDISFANGTLTVSGAASSGVLAASATLIAPNDSLTLTATLSPTPPATGVPTGTVQFKVDGANLGSPVALVGGVAELVTTDLTYGTYALTAVYGGDGNFGGTTMSLASSVVVNTPPESGNDTINRYRSRSVKVLLSELMDNDTDGDGEALTLSSLATSSALGGTVVLSGDWVVYMAPEGSNDPDSFSYTIEDPIGQQSMATVNVQVLADSGINENLTITDLGNGSFDIELFGIPNEDYSLEYTEDMEPPTWLNLIDFTTDALGRYQHVDTPPEGTARYYRSVWTE